MTVAFPIGTIVVEGHELHEEDIRLIYTFDQATGGTTQFEAHSDAQVFFYSLEHLPKNKNIRGKKYSPMFLQGQRSLVGCCLWGRTESDTTEAT